MAEHESQSSRGEGSDLIEKTVSINRVAKVVKGGRRFSFSALVVVGDGKGRVGVGLGKAGEVPEAIRKANAQARKSMMLVPIKGTTITHDVLGEYGPVKVVLKPAAPGTGVIAGSVARAILEAAGIRDIRTKCIGSSNPHNVVHACLNGLKGLRNPNEVADLRGLSLEEMGYHPY